MKIKLCIPLLLISIISFSQKNDSLQIRRIHSAAIKFSPLHMLNYYPSMQLAFEHRLGRQTSLQWEGGYVFPISSEETSDAYNKRGFKAKLDFRYYWLFGKLNAFIAPELYYNSVNYNKNGTFGIDCSNGCDYYRYAKYETQYREKGINLKVGMLHRFGRISFEYFAGISQRFIEYKSVNKPEGGESPQLEDSYDSPFRPKELTRNFIQPTTSLRIGYIFE
jgi:hypothetical protein